MLADAPDSPLHSDADLKKVADKHNASVATVLISWAVNRGTVVLPKSVTPSRIESNRNVISLDKDDMAILDQMASGGRQHRFNTPAWNTDFVSRPSLELEFLRRSDERDERDLVKREIHIRHETDTH